jgi:Flp pilus assembly protein TadB
MLLYLAIASLAAAVYFVGEVATQPSRDRRQSLRRATEYGRVRIAGANRTRFRERVIAPAMQRLATLALRLNPRVTIAMLDKKLLAAGLGRRITPQGFLAAKGGAACAAGFFGLVIGGSTSGFGGGLLFAVLGGAAGFVIPGLVVSMRTKKRREELRAQLPDALDLLAVSVEAGLGFDGAITKLTEHMEGALTEELSLTLNEMRIGESRHEALKKLSERSAAPEVANFSRAIIQADQLGISLGRILRVQAVDTRNRRQAAAEERAMKAPIKMLFPTVAFIFPAMFLVILGPALINISKVF